MRLNNDTDYGMNRGSGCDMNNCFGAPGMNARNLTGTDAHGHAGVFDTRDMNRPFGGCGCDRDAVRPDTGYGDVRGMGTGGCGCGNGTPRTGGCGCGGSARTGNRGGGHTPGTEQNCGCGARQSRNGRQTGGLGRSTDGRNTGCGCGQTPACGQDALRVRTDGRDRDRDKDTDCGCGDSLMQRIREADFVLCELVLYLDAYPDCCQALAMYHEALERRNELVKAWECKHGPLTCLGNQSRTSWDWTAKPFPWEIEANE